MRAEFEAFLALLYTNEETRARFLIDPLGEARRAGLLPDECHALERIDRAGLQLAARSLARRRAQKTAALIHRTAWLRQLSRLRRFISR